MGKGADVDDNNYEMSLTGQAWSAVPALRTGYIESTDGDALLDFARELGTVLRMERSIGEFVVEGSPLVSVANQVKCNEHVIAKLNAIYVISNQRSV